MQNWNEVVGGTPAWQSLDRFAHDVADLESRHAGQAFVQRARNLAEQLKARLQTIDPDLVYAELLSNMGPVLDSSQQILRDHLEPPDGVEPTPPEAVKVALDKVAKEFMYLSVPLGNAPTDAVAIVEAMRIELAALSEEARRRIEALTGEIAALTTEVANLGDEPVASLENRLEVAGQEVTQAVANANALQASFTSTFVSSEELRTKDYERELGEFRKAAATEADEIHAAWEAKLGQSESAANALLAELESRRDEAVGLVHAIGRAGLTAGFGEWEITERRSATRLRWTSIFFGALAAAVVIMIVLYHLDDTTKQGTDWALTVGTVAIASTLGAVSKYAATESAKHRTNAVFARRQALDLASFAPFIETLTEDERAVMTAYFVPVFFGQANATDPQTAEALASLRLSPSQLIEALKNAMSHRGKRAATPPT